MILDGRDLFKLIQGTRKMNQEQEGLPVFCSETFCCWWQLTGTDFVLAFKTYQGFIIRFVNGDGIATGRI